MERFPTRVRRSGRERSVAWIYTGPLGHLYGLVADVAELWVRYSLSRVRVAVEARLRPRRAAR